MRIPKQELIERLHDHLLKRLGGETGPLNPNSLDAAIERSKTAVYGLEPFKDVVAKSAALGYGIIVWCPFLDGNKRTGVFSMKLMLEANGIQMALPPYIVKYSVQAALPPESGLHIDEQDFIKKIAKLCYTSSLSGRWKEWRYSTYPRATLRGYILLLQRFPNSKVFVSMLEQTLLDWYAAGDRDTMVKVVNEWQKSSAQGFPKEIPPLSIGSEDFDNYPTLPDEA